MHNLIFELSTTPLKKEDWVSDFSLCEDREIDYCRLLDDDERKEAIENDMVKHSLFGRLFAPGDTPDTIVLTSAFEGVKKVWYGEIQKAVDTMVTDNMADGFEVIHAIKHPFNNYTRFVLSDYVGTNLSLGVDELFEMLGSMETGDKLYIGAVLDYHW